MPFPTPSSNRGRGKRPGQRDNRINPGGLVEYQQHGMPRIAVVEKFAGKKWDVLTENNERISLQSDRIFKDPAVLPVKDWPDSQKVAFLKQFSMRAERKVVSIKLEDVWTKAKEFDRAQSVEVLCQKVFGNETALTLLALRRSLLLDTVFFKRKGPLFEALSEDDVKTRKEERERVAKQKELLTKLVEALEKRLAGEDSELSEEVVILEEAAALGSKAPRAAEAKLIFEELSKKKAYEGDGNLSLKARRLLKQTGHYGENPNLSLVRHGISRSYPEALSGESLEELLSNDDASERADLSELFCITVDDIRTLDRDDAISLEETETGLRIGIHIADVSSYATGEENPVMAEALKRGSSVYCPDDTVHMLPPELSEDKFSLVAGEPRRALSYFVELKPDGELGSYNLQRTTIKVAENLSFDQANAILCDEERPESDSARVLKGLWDLSSNHETKRITGGAIQFNRRDFLPKLGENGRLELKAATDETPGFKVVSEMMILCNHVTAKFAEEKGIPILFRGQENPNNLDFLTDQSVAEGPAREYFFRSQMKPSAVKTKPASHCGLGLSAYTQTSSPIRRTGDLLNQLQICASLEGRDCPYSAEQLMKIHTDLQPAIAAVNAVQTERNRYWLIKYFEQEQIKTFPATIVKVAGPKPLAEMEATSSTIPFRPAADNFSGRLGEKVELEIEDLSSEKERLRLQEKGAPKLENKKPRKAKGSPGEGRGPGRGFKNGNRKAAGKAAPNKSGGKKKPNFGGKRHGERQRHGQGKPGKPKPGEPKHRRSDDRGPKHGKPDSRRKHSKNQRPDFKKPGQEVEAGASTSGSEDQPSGSAKTTQPNTPGAQKNSSPSAKHQSEKPKKTSGKPEEGSLGASLLAAIAQAEKPKTTE